MKQTVAQLMTSVANTFPRGNISGWQSYFNTNLEVWLYELCDFPFWFLVQNPSPNFWGNFPICNYASIPLPYGQWAATGWLILEQGVSLYSMATPFEEDNEALTPWWSIFRAASLDVVKLHDHTGRELQDLEVLPANDFYSRYYYSGSTICKGMPKYCSLRTTESGSSIVIWPKPDKPYPLSVTWTLRESPPYISPSDSNTYAKFLSWAPNAVLYKCLAQTASFFNESEMRKEFEAQLYGTPGVPKGDFNSITQVGGIIGALKEETYRKGSQRHQQAKFYGSCAKATGRHNPYSGGLTMPIGYGYIF